MKPQLIYSDIHSLSRNTKPFVFFALFVTGFLGLNISAFAANEASVQTEQAQKGKGPDTLYEMVPHIVLPKSIQYKPMPTSLTRPGEYTGNSARPATYVAYPSYVLPYPAEMDTVQQAVYPVTPPAQSSQSLQNAHLSQVNGNQPLPAAYQQILTPASTPAEQPAGVIPRGTEQGQLPEEPATGPALPSRAEPSAAFPENRSDSSSETSLQTNSDITQMSNRRAKNRKETNANPNTSSSEAGQTSSFQNMQMNPGLVPIAQPIAPAHGLPLQLVQQQPSWQLPGYGLPGAGQPTPTVYPTPLKPVSDPNNYNLPYSNSIALNPYADQHQPAAAQAPNAAAASQAQSQQEIIRQIQQLQAQNPNLQISAVTVGPNGQMVPIPMGPGQNPGQPGVAAGGYAQAPQQNPNDIAQQQMQYIQRMNQYVQQLNAQQAQKNGCGQPVQYPQYGYANQGGYGMAPSIQAIPGTQGAYAMWNPYYGAYYGTNGAGTPSPYQYGNAGGYGMYGPYGQQTPYGVSTMTNPYYPMPQMQQGDGSNEDSEKSFMQRFRERRHSSEKKMCDAWKAPHYPADTAMRMPAKEAYPWGYFGAQVSPAEGVNFGGYNNMYSGSTTCPGQ